MGKNGKKGSGKYEKVQSTVPDACLYCNSTEDDELKYGKLIYHEQKKIRVHHYCLLFASGLCQRGEGNDEKGIEGFLIPDIMAEFKRGSRLRCTYCKHTRATVGCVIKSCRSMYHFGCGVENKAIFLFYDNFISYCQVHRPQQDPPEVPSQNPTSICPICLESVDAKVSDETLRTPCCTNTWFHRICVQRQALSAGYFFRCGICNNKEDFQREMKQFGIYIPEQDAAWELEDNAYQELYQRHNQCDINPCICPKGRKYHPSRGQWEVVLCDTCGSRGCHLTCGGLTNQWDDWVCDQCEDIVAKLDKSRWGQASKSNKSSKKASIKSKSTTPKEKRKEKLTGKSPRSPLPSRKPIKKKAAPSTCPSLSPPSPSDSMANLSQLSIHLPSVSASPNDGVYFTDSSQCSSTPCSQTVCGSSSKKKSKFKTPCKDASDSCRKHLSLSATCSPPYGSPPLFCCTSKDSYAHSHSGSSIPPSLSVETNAVSKDSQKHHNGHVCHKYVSPTSTSAVKTTKRMSMRGPASGTPAFKRAQESFASLTKSGMPHIHHHSLSGVHLCARHRQQMQHSNIASWNHNNSSGSNSSSVSTSSSSSHNSSSSSDDIEYGTVHLTPDGKVTSSGIKNLDVSSSTAAVVQLKPLSNLMPVLCQRVSLGSNDSESQAILGSALAKQVNLVSNAKPGLKFQHTCSKRKLENKEPSAPRKKFKIGKSPPPKKVESKSPNPRKMLKVPSPQKTTKSLVKNQSPKKVDKSVKKKVSTTPQKLPKKSTTPKKAREFISLKQKGKSPKGKAGNINKSQKQLGNTLEMEKMSTASPKKKFKLGYSHQSKTSSSPRIKMHVKTSALFSGKAKMRLSSSPPDKASPMQKHTDKESTPYLKEALTKPPAPLETMLKTSASQVEAKKPAVKKILAKMKKPCEILAGSKQGTLDKFLQPLTINIKPDDHESSVGQRPDSSSTGVIEVEAENNESGEKRKTEGICEDIYIISEKKQKTASQEASTLAQAGTKKTPSQESQGQGSEDAEGQKNTANPGQSNSSGVLTDLLLKSPKLSRMDTSAVTKGSSEKKRLTRSSRRWNAHMDSGEVVFSRSPPAVKSPVNLSSQIKQAEGNQAGHFSFTDSGSASSIPAKKDVVKSLESDFLSQGAGTPNKVTRRKAECRFATRSSPRLMKEKKVSKIAINQTATTCAADKGRVWVPASNNKETIALATISFDKVTGKSSLLINTASPKPIEIPIRESGSKQSLSSSYALLGSSPVDSSGKKSQKVRMEILFPDGSSSRGKKDKRLLTRFEPAQKNGNTAMSQDVCFLEMQEFTKTMLATANPTNKSDTASKVLTTASSVNANLLQETASRKGSADCSKEVTKVDKKNDCCQKEDGQAPGPEKDGAEDEVILQQSKDDEDVNNEENGIESPASSPEEDRNLVRRSSRFDNSPTTGKILVRRSRKYLHRNYNPCDNCKQRRRRCFHYMCLPVKKKPNKIDKSGVSLSVMDGDSNNSAEEKTDVSSTELETLEYSKHRSAINSKTPNRKSSLLKKGFMKKTVRSWHKDLAYHQRQKNGIGRRASSSPAVRRRSLEEKQKAASEHEEMKDKDEVNGSLNTMNGSHHESHAEGEILGPELEKHASELDPSLCELNPSLCELTPYVTVPQYNKESTCQIKMDSNGLKVERKLGEQDDESRVESGDGSQGEVSQTISASAQLSISEQAQKEPSVIGNASNNENAEVAHAVAPVDNVEEPKEPPVEVGEIDMNKHQLIRGDQTPIKGTEGVSEQTKIASSQSEIKLLVDELQSSDGLPLKSDATSSNEQTSSAQSTPTSSPNTKSMYNCKKKHNHTPRCKKAKHVHYPVCDSPHLHGPHAKSRRGSQVKKKEKGIPLHVHKPKCLAPHLHGPAPADGIRIPKNVISEVTPKEKEDQEICQQVPDEVNTTEAEKNEKSLE